MATKRTPIVKLSRRLGITLGKEKYVKRRPYPPGVHGPKQARRRPRLSSFGEQLKEKQKAKAIYGVMEKQFAGYFEKATRREGNTAENLVQLLETRLDNVIYRLGWARTRRQSRQMVSHGFIQVNGARVDIPSFIVSVGDVITVKASKVEKGIIKVIPEAMNLGTLPSWISRDEKTMTGKITAIPEGEDLKQGFDPTFIVEFYSR
ncbi:30S ribosomal protein S4 [Candidatus Uhrbacteria bacterium CG10_big_fil_rev_8_21_14_0_10_48_16]|uniref:Small ribosomal subunit protein uS4 n=1 Tax=Candidatus Uhrbacteria bacterium CG10_big_fil_rev_8_21_14_0_10_48_16 TaxID=1975038 RepID=A0A2M8LGA4_9BACT|nr:MAG: 30S ribosomal protein S4 [Candidatus Uhrbacteria bacterium CG10_big_fil_rev_8_21_14_0_10_48_16]